MLPQHTRSLALLPLCVLVACGGASTGAHDGSLDDGGEPVDAAVQMDGGEQDLGEGADGSIPPPPIDLAGADLSPRMVQGKVLDYYDAPVPGWKVSIGGMQATTDASGSFTLIAPGGFYDVLVAGLQAADQDAPGNGVVGHYLGLTRSDPVLRLGTRVVEPAFARQATVSGTCTGIATPLDAMTNGQVGVDLDANNGKSYFGNTAASLGFTANASYNGAASQSSTVRAVLSRELGGGPFSVIGYGQAAVTPNAGSDTVVGNLALTMPATQNLTATLEPVAGAQSHFSTRVQIGGVFANTSVYTTIPAGGVLSLPQPVIAGGVIRFAATSPFSAPPFRYGTIVYEGLAPNAALGTVTIPTPATIAMPPGAPNAVPRNADFGVNGAGAAGQVRVFNFVAGNNQWQVVTTATSAKFPDASGLGVANPTSGTEVKGTVIEHGFPTVDAVAAMRSHLDSTKVVDSGQPYRMTVTSMTAFFFAN